MTTKVGQAEVYRKMNWRLLIAALLAVGAIATQWLYGNRSDAIYERVMSRQGYDTTLVKEGISTTFLLKPEWIPEGVGEENKLNLVLEKKFNTTILLESVTKQNNDIYVQLNAIPSMSLRAGRYLTTSLILDNGSFTTSGAVERWQVTDNSGRDLLNGSYGATEGPSNMAGISFDFANEDVLREGVTIRFAGYNLYGYRQHDGGLLASAWLPFSGIAVLIVLILLYRRREEAERGLGWKLAGYTLLGCFTFSINTIKLPLGFLVYLLFFRKPVPNARTKRNAALLGLTIYATGLLWPAISEEVGWRERDVRMEAIPYEALGMEGIWRSVLAETSVTDQAKISSFELVRTKEGDVLKAEFRLVDRVNDEFVFSEVAYDGEGNRMKYSPRGSSDTWLQYNEGMYAALFFERFEKLRMLDWRPSGDDAYVMLKLLDDRPVQYAINDAVKFKVDEAGIHSVANDQLPIQGMLFTVGGAAYPDPSSWAGWTDYLFNVTN
ncbi:hypothetical protein [Paenibacillus sp. PAMC21692]|uniref:hypothetical protein n=1 Tax=Paenibacillus sp. PAMC21692 TaxID=2762320 RepID=UPI00164D20A2|nr:hypothetical protein [Paenibacillus sp. PAMC21692]QNK59268.1 hypothetical protein H7F31_10530 [Paenibacillus sp. PAMC21692]